MQEEGIARIFAEGNGGDGNSVELTQELNVVVPDGSGVTVSVSAQAVSCTTFACNIGGFEGPVGTSLTYLADDGEEKRITLLFQYETRGLFWR